MTYYISSVTLHPTHSITHSCVWYVCVCVFRISLRNPSAVYWRLLVLQKTSRGMCWFPLRLHNNIVLFFSFLYIDCLPVVYLRNLTKENFKQKPKPALSNNGRNMHKFITVRLTLTLNLVTFLSLTLTPCFRKFPEVKGTKDRSMVIP